MYAGVITGADCSDDSCTEHGGTCVTKHGIYVVGVVCCIIGAVLYLFIRSRIAAMQEQKEGGWCLTKPSETVDSGHRHEA